MNIIMLCGPPGAGKTTYMKENSQPGDKCVDIDLIPKDRPLKARMQLRKDQLRLAARLRLPSICWFNTAAPTRAQRDYWRSIVPISQTIILQTPIDKCIRRATERDGGPKLVPGIYRWFELYEPPHHESNTLLIVGE